MTAPIPQPQPSTYYENWILHRQPADQIVDHKFSIWSGEHPVVLANEMPGEDGTLAYIVSELNSYASLKAKVEGLEDLASNIAEMDDALLKSANLGLLRATLREFRELARALLQPKGAA